jgi:hypothetical protein
MAITPLSSDREFGDWVYVAAQKADVLVPAIEAGEIEYLKWYQFSYAKSDAQIAALPGFENRTEADIAKIRLIFEAMHDFYKALHNVATVSQRDRMGDLVPVI